MSGRGGWDLSDCGVSGPRPLSFSASCFSCTELSYFTLPVVPQEARPAILEAPCVSTFLLAVTKLCHRNSLGVPPNYELKQTFPSFLKHGSKSMWPPVRASVAGKQRERACGHQSGRFRGREAEREAGAQLAVSYLFGPQPTEWHCPQLGWVLQHKLTQFRNSCRQP